MVLALVALAVKTSQESSHVPSGGLTKDISESRCVQMGIIHEARPTWVFVQAGMHALGSLAAVRATQLGAKWFSEV